MAREMAVAEGLIHNWKKAVKANNTDSENELIELKRKLREVEMERDILKKAALIFATENQLGCVFLSQNMPAAHP